MTSMIAKFKEKLLKNKLYTIIIMIFAILVLSFGIKQAYAYYYTKQSFPILSALVGDFDVGKGDINILIYKQAEKDKDLYTRSYAVPAMGYEFDQSKTACTDGDNKTLECTYKENGVEGVAEGSSNNCSYSYDKDTRTFTLTSNQKTTCKFYFKQTVTSDIDIYIMKEDENGVDGKWKPESTTDGEEVVEKNYTMVEHIPAYGYRYAGYKCENDNTNDESKKITVNYDSTTRKFKVETSKKTKCYAYFNSEGPADIIAHVYIKDTDVNSENGGSEVYTLVDTIPEGKKYKLASGTEGGNNKSQCYKQGHQESKLDNVQVTYTENGYISISDVTEPTECDVYLDVDPSSSVQSP